jgi:isopenicillin-N epimerase
MKGQQQRKVPRASALASVWSLDPDVVFLNHGSFGACPREVLDTQLEIRRRMESEPVRFFVRDSFGSEKICES